MSHSDGRQEVFVARNWSGEAGEFFVSEAEFRRCERFRRQRNLRIRAFFHSHAHSLELSDLDTAGLRRSPWPWVVIALSAGTLRFRVHQPPVQGEATGRVVSRH